MSLLEIEKLVDLVADSQVLEVTIETEARRVTVRKNAPRPAHKTVSPDVVREPVKESEPEPSVAEEPVESDFWTITAPMVGFFYAADPPVVNGGRVEPGEVVGAIESMKLMNEVRADQAGIVLEVVIESGHAVEYGQPLFTLERATEDGETDEENNA